MKKLLSLTLILFAFLSIISCSSDDDTSEPTTGKKTFKVQIDPLIDATDIERIGVAFQIPSTDADLNINGTFELVANNVIEFKQYEIEFTDVENTITIETTEEVEKPIEFIMVIYLMEQNTGTDLDVLDFKAYSDDLLFFEKTVQVFPNLQQGVLQLEFENW
jgi:uncharacterized membrane protein